MITSIPNRTNEGLPYIAINRIPAGYTMYPTSRADDIANGTYGNGVQLILDAANPTKRFQLLHHWFAVGAKAIWENAGLVDNVSGILVAPASTGLTQETGDFNKYPLGGPYNMIYPVPAGTGSWNMNLAARLNANCDILKAVPVPAIGHNGFFDYDQLSNVITPNPSQAGDYNLYDFEINLFRFVNQAVGRAAPAGYGVEAEYSIPDVIGKMLFNFWQIKIDLNAQTSGVKCAIELLCFASKTI